MPLFDRHMAVDWSANNTPKRGKDSIWIAGADGAAVNPPTRHAALDQLRTAIRAALSDGVRLHIGFDFAFGYPQGFATRLGLDDWQGVWAEIAARVEDASDNRSNRFAVAEGFNRKLGIDPPPFWGHPWQHSYTDLQPTRPSYPVLAERRLCELGRTGTQPVWKLAYTGSVGSQTLLGIAALERLRREPEFADAISIWPFQTNFTEDLSRPVTFSEIYPSQHALETDRYRCKDEAQVEAVVRDFRAWDATGALREKLSAPNLSGPDRAAALREEGWIVGR